MRRALEILSILMLFSLTATAKPQQAQPEFEAIYEGRVKIFSGKVNLSVARAPPEGYVFEYSLQPGRLLRLFTKGYMQETSTFSLVDGRPRPNDYTLINTVGKRPRNGSATFDWNQGRLRGQYKNKVIDIPIPATAVDRSLLLLVLMSDLRRDDVREQYAVYDKDEFISVSVTRLGEETITVAAGTYQSEVLRYTSPDGDSTTTLWCATALEYLPVRIETRNGRRKIFQADLAQVSGLPDK